MLSQACRAFIIAVVAAVVFTTGTAKGASLVFQKTPGSSGNLFAMDEFGEPWEVGRSGQNPSLDRWGRLILYYQEGDIKITDIQGEHVEIANEMSPEPTMPVHPQWLPGGGIIFDGDGDIHLEIFGPFGRVVYTPVSWAGNQSSPTVYADGKKIAFLSDTKPNGEKLSGTGPAVYVADMPSSEGNPVENPVQVTNPASVTAVSGPSFSPDGTKVAIEALTSANKYKNTDIVTLVAATGKLTRMTTLEGNDSAPYWLADGRIAFVRHSKNGKEAELMTIEEGGKPKSLVKPYTGSPSLPALSGRQFVNLEPLPTTYDARIRQLLLNFSPTLRFDDAEIYRNIATESITNLYSGTSPEESNRLVNESGTAIAYSNPLLSSPPLSSGFLSGQGEKYTGTEIVALESDRLVERESYSEDAAAFQSNPAYQDRIYARAVYIEGQWWFQYWFWYYYNEFLESFGDHEGDWEMIQIGIGELENPVSVTYAQHGDDEADSCDFLVLDWTIGKYANLSPVVYVARGSHASYVRPGTFLGDFGTDEADGDGYVSRPLVEMFPSSEWGVWPGRWGNSLGTADSPMAPISQESKWTTPGEFDAQAEECPGSEEGEPQDRIAPRPEALQGPPPPIIEAARHGDSVAVQYRLADATNKVPKSLHVAVLASSKAVTPTKVRVSPDRRGVVTVPLPQGSGPYTVVAQAFGKHYAPGQETKVQLRD